jgi:hypothetical protein
MAEVGMIDPARQEEFVGKIVEQISGTMTTLLAAVGDRLGLFKNWQNRVRRHRKSSHRGRS